MDVSPLQIESAMGDIGLTDVQRSDVSDLFGTIKEAKQETLRMETCTNPYQNVVPENVLRDLSSQLMNLTDEQRSFVDYAEEMILDNKQVLAFLNASAGTGKTYTLNTFIARMLLKKNKLYAVHLRVLLLYFFSMVVLFTLTSKQVDIQMWNED